MTAASTSRCAIEARSSVRRSTPFRASRRAELGYGANDLLFLGLGRMLVLDGLLTLLVTLVLAVAAIARFRQCEAVRVVFEEQRRAKPAQDQRLAEVAPRHHERMVHPSRVEHRNGVNEVGKLSAEAVVREYEAAVS